MSKNFKPPKLPIVDEVSDADDNINDLDTAVSEAFGSAIEPAVLGVYTSSAQTITSATNYEFTHGLGGQPLYCQILLECTTAEFGYSIGDRISPSLSHHKIGGNYSIQIPSSELTTKVHVISGAAAYDSGKVFSAVNQATHAVVSLTNANWEMYLVAYAFKTTYSSYSGTSDTTNGGPAQISAYTLIETAANTAFVQAETDITAGTFFDNVISESFKSTDQTITASSAITLPHGMASAPKIISVMIKCTSTDLGYTVGQEVNISNQPGSNCLASVSGGVEVEFDATNVIIRIPSGGLAVADLTDTTWYADAAIDQTKWDLYVRAYA